MSEALAQVKLYLLDVEGTVAPLTLTTSQLFPYARRHFAEFLEKSWKARAVQEDLLLLAEENLCETEEGAPKMMARAESGIALAALGGEALRARAFEYLLWLMDRDRKSTALKSLQGKIWKAGFESGELKGTLFDDVPDALRRWVATGKVAIYSSGSVEAQKLLFRHSNFGDLTPLIAEYFDTRTGPKTMSASYAAIAQAMGVARDEVVFLSDSIRELDGAREAGCLTRFVVRPGNAPAGEANGHITVESFASL
jgi:enolase-phosphatase E1